MDYIKLLELGMKPCQHIYSTMDSREGKLTRLYSSKGTKMSSMGELAFFLGLQVQQKKDGIFIRQDKYDEDGEEVDVHMYRSMIGSLMYLTSSRPDIIFAMCACARYQVNLKVSHLYAMKRIFRWYLKDSPFDLVAYTNSDYARASLDRKSTIGGCQFLGCRLISWQCKKQTVGRRINDIDEDEDITLVSVQDDADAEMFDVGTLTGDEVFAEQEVAAKDVNLTIDKVTLAQALAALKSIKPKAKRIAFRELGESTTTTIPIPSKFQDKGKGKMIEPEPVKKLSKKDQLKLNEENALKLQAEIDEEERFARAEEEKINEANIAWDDIQAKVDADY
ncbi:hypothetical protein Tco_1317278 [Tanacetum coccineum]